MLAAARDGDQWAFNRLFHRHRPRALRYARAFRVGAVDADEAVATAFARTFRVIQLGAGPVEALMPYLIVAVRNAVLEAMRTGKIQMQYVDDLSEYEELGTGGDDVSPDERVSQARRAFDSLPAAWRQVLWATQVEGYRARQVAVALDMSPNAAAALAMRARQGLRRAYLDLDCA